MVVTRHQFIQVAGQRPGYHVFDGASFQAMLLLVVVVRLECTEDRRLVRLPLTLTKQCHKHTLGLSKPTVFNPSNLKITGLEVGKTSTSMDLFPTLLPPSPFFFPLSPLPWPSLSLPSPTS